MIGEKIYFGIDDLAANAFIHLLNNGEKDLEVTLLSLEHYGDHIIKWLKENKNIISYGIYSRQMTNRVFDIHDDIFKESELNGKHSIKLVEGTEVETLINKFRGYIEYELLEAFLNVKYTK